MASTSVRKPRFRLYEGQRNYEFETHNAEGVQVVEITKDQWRENVLEELCSLDAIDLVVIFHDKDRKDDGGLKGLHCHFIIRFENPRSYEQTLENVKAERRNFKVVRNKVGTYRYLTHSTDAAMNELKYRYPVEELQVFVRETSKDEYEKLTGGKLWEYYREKISQKGKVANPKVNTDEFIADMLYDLADGVYIENWDIKEELIEVFGKTDGVLAWTKNKKHFENARSEYYEKKFRDWKEHGRKFQAVYVNGPSTIGKSTFANLLGRKINQENGRLASLIHDAPNATKGTRFDFVQDYQNELVTIFDDLSPETFGYEEFLNLFESDKVARANSRFENKPWFAEYAIITRSLPLEEWTEKLASGQTKKGSDAFGKSNVLWQPRRRFYLAVEFDFEKVTIYRFKVISRVSNNHEREILKTIHFNGQVFLDSEELQDEIVNIVWDLLQQKPKKRNAS